MIELFADDDGEFEAAVEARIQAMRQDPASLLAQFDLNGDGQIDAQEWRAIRKLIGHELMKERSHHDQSGVVGAYTVVSKIRPGASGLATLARSAEGKLVVLKHMQLNHADSWHEADRFRREAEILSSMKDHRIPEFIDAFEVEGDGAGFVVVQSFVDGEDLELALSRGAVFDESTIVDIARQTLRLLAYLHAQKPGVIHRDIKPSNLLVDTEGDIHLVDFGGACRVGEPVDDVIATPGYAAPEQIMGHAVPSSDLYGLGATLVHLATGRAPDTLEMESLKLEWR